MRNIMTFALVLLICFGCGIKEEVEMNQVVKRVLSTFKDHDVVFLGEAHNSPSSRTLENLIIEKAIAEYEVRHVGVEIPDEIGKQLIAKYRDKADGKYSDTEIAFFNWMKAIDNGNKKLSGENAEIFFFDAPIVGNNENIDCEELPICTEMIRATTHRFKKREPFMAERIARIYAQRKGKLLIITGNLHIFKRPFMFGIPSLAEQLKGNPDSTPYVEMKQGKIEFPDLTIDDVCYKEKPLAFRLMNCIGEKNVYSIYISSSDGDPLFEFAKQASSSVITTCNSNISWKSVPGESLYEFMTNGKKVPVSELFDLYINVLLF